MVAAEMVQSHKLVLRVPSSFFAESLGQECSRADWLNWIWSEFGSQGLQGIHEGTMLAQEAHEKGFETDPWIVDQGLAPEHRDWMSEQSQSQIELYFNVATDAKRVEKRVREDFPEVEIISLEEVEAQDWDAEWKKNYQGAKVPPNWWIIPPWMKETPEVAGSSDRILILNPGAGFGTGTHPTTQLCLRTLSENWRQIAEEFHSVETLDFGSGSGILSVATALLGGTALGCEIDELANENARENASLNGVSDRVKFQTQLPLQTKKFPLLIANILKPILLEYGPELMKRLERGGFVILSGLIEKDLEEILPRYQALLGREYVARILALEEWRAVYWRKS